MTIPVRPVRPIGRLVLLATILLAALVPASRAAAAPPRPPKIAGVVFGFDNHLVPERWNPVLVSLMGGEENFNAEIVIDHPQDATQSATLHIPVAITANTPITVLAAFNAPASTSEIDLTLVRADTGATAIPKLHFTNMGDDRQTLPLPHIASLNPVAIGVLNGIARDGSGLSDALAASWAGPASSAYSNDSAYIADIPAGAMPTSAMAYESLALLVVRAPDAAQLDARALTAIRQWVLAGGRLAIIADQPGDEWRRWLPPGANGDLLSVADPAVVPMPPRLAAVLRENAVRLRSSRDRAGESDANNADDTVRFDPAATLPVRALTLSPLAREQGWTHSIPLNAADSSPHALAQGPVGMGWCVVLGFDPRRAPATVSDAASARLWHAALVDALSDINPGLDATYSRYFEGSGDTQQGAQRLTSLIDHLCTVAPLDHRVFIVIAIAMTALALMLALGDFFLLGRLRLRHRSHRFALLWIVLACGVAYAAPVWLRSGESVVNRAEIVDVLQWPSDDPAAGPLAFATGVTTAFANTPAHAQWTGLPPSSFVRGVSSLAFTGFRQSASSAPQSVHWTWQAPALAGEDTSACLPSGGKDRARFSGWTLRVFQDQARVRTPFFIAPELSAGRPTIRIMNLPAGATCESALVRCAGEWFGASVAVAPAADGAASTEGTLTLTGSRSDKRVGAWADEPDDVSLRRHIARMSNGDEAPTDISPAATLWLAGAHQRTLALDTRSATSAWAVVYLSLDHLPPTTTLIPGAKATRRAVYRVCIRVSPEWAAAAGVSFAPATPSTPASPAETGAPR